MKSITTAHRNPSSPS